ncbi:MAG: serine/threonine-protein kinase [Planctomycetota bacterium]
MSADDLTAPDDDRLRGIVAECLERAEAEGPAAIETVCAAHPNLAARIRAALRQLQVGGLLEVAGDAVADLPRQIGEYRLLRRLGEGGMGVVFLAEQARLRREVALKLMRADLVWVEGAKERLLREVQAVAGLNHPAIVKVYDVGDHGDRPYYSMEVVAGLTLADVIDRFRGSDPATLRGSDLLAALRTGDDAAVIDDNLFAGSWAQVALRVIQRVAGALAHAHERGIVHRDVKPSNVMLTGDGRVVLLDFGLAQMPGTPRITRTGAVLGSLAYMSPEQLGRLPVDQRTDVYSLGVTLYEMLTLRSAFAEQDPSGIEWRILQGVVASPRKVNRSIPADADTVCCKAMERQSCDRYADMVEFADDLGNVLELRPVRARRPGLLRRSVRLAQRHRAWTTGVAAVLVLGIAVPLLWFWQESRAEQRVLDGKLDEAQQFLDAMHARIRDERLVSLAGGSVIQQEMIQDVLEHFERTLALQPNNQALCRTGIRLLHEYGRLFERLNTQQEAARAYERCLDLAEQLEQPTEADDRILAAAWTGRVAAVQSANRYDEAAAIAKRAIAFHESAAARWPENRYLALSQASIHLLLSKMASAAGRTAERDREMQRGIDRVLPFANAGDDEVDSQLAQLRAERAGYLRIDGDPESALAEFAAAVATQRGVVERQPHDERFAGRLAQAVMGYGVLLEATKRADEAERLLQDSCARIEALVARFPEHYVYRSTLGGLLNNLAQTRLQQNRNAEAIDLLDRAIGHQRAYLERNPDNRYANAFLANHRMVRVFALVQEGRHRDLDGELDAFAELRGATLGNALAADASAKRIAACRADQELSEAERGAMLQHYERQTFALLRAAVDAGLRAPEMMARPSFADLHDQEALADLRAVVRARAEADSSRSR